MIIPVEPTSVIVCVRQSPSNNTPCKNDKNRDLIVYKRWNDVENTVMMANAGEETTKKLFESSR